MATKHKEVTVPDIYKNETSPNHYSKYEIEPWYFITKNNLSFLQGNIIKYVVRYKDKNGLVDLEKAKKCNELLIEHEQTNTFKKEERVNDGFYDAKDY